MYLHRGGRFLRGGFCRARHVFCCMNGQVACIQREKVTFSPGIERLLRLCRCTAVQTSDLFVSGIERLLAFALPAWRGGRCGCKPGTRTGVGDGFVLVEGLTLDMSNPLFAGALAWLFALFLCWGAVHGILLSLRRTMTCATPSS